MNVDSTGSMQQMQQMQMRIGNGGYGQGQGSMKDIMQSLSPEDRTTMKEQLSSMSQEDRVSIISQMKEIDSTSMSSEEYSQTLLDILNQSESEENDYTSGSFSVYV